MYSEESLHPKQFVVPKYTTTQRDLLVAEIGTLVWDTTLGSLAISNAKALGSWTMLN